MGSNGITEGEQRNRPATEGVANPTPSGRTRRIRSSLGFSSVVARRPMPGRSEAGRQPVAGTGNSRTSKSDSTVGHNEASDNEQDSMATAIGDP